MDDSLVDSFLPPDIIDNIRESRAEAVSEGGMDIGCKGSFHVTDVAVVDAHEPNNQSEELKQVPDMDATLDLDLTVSQKTLADIQIEAPEDTVDKLKQFDNELSKLNTYQNDILA